MRLEVFSSKLGIREPNLVAIQAADLTMLPTVLVCPMLVDRPVTSVRTVASFSDKDYTVICDLARPIHRRARQKVGELNRETSRRILATFTLLLAR